MHVCSIHFTVHTHPAGDQSPVRCIMQTRLLKETQLCLSQCLIPCFVLRHKVRLLWGLFMDGHWKFSLSSEFEFIYVLWCHIGIHTHTHKHTHIHTLVVCTVLFTYPWKVCCSPACVYAVFRVWLNSPSRDLSSLAGREEKITSPSILMFDIALPLCLLPSLFYVSRLLFAQLSSDRPCLWCWEVICLYVRAVLSLCLSCLAPPSPLGFA